MLAALPALPRYLFIPIGLILAFALWIFICCTIFQDQEEEELPRYTTGCRRGGKTCIVCDEKTALIGAEL